ncbi:MAG TPA: hypothetical protein VFZ34_05580, partial [Blastocatellia bacterium]|nr:hypothetical protein [Blastocatellia bacterium]
MLHRNHILPLFLTGTVLVFMLSVSGFAQFASSDLNKLNRFVQSTNASDKAARAFRTGRDLIEDEKWEQAE